MWTQDDTLAYLKGKGKGNRSHSSGKGFGRRKNPRDRNGNLTRCSIWLPVALKEKEKANRLSLQPLPVRAEVISLKLRPDVSLPIRRQAHGTTPWAPS